MNYIALIACLITALSMAFQARAQETEGVSTSKSLFELTDEDEHHRLGLLYHYDETMGLTFERTLTNHLNFWSQITYRPATRPEYSADGFMSYRENHRIQALIGLDALLPLDRRRTWNLIGGAGVGIRRASIETDYTLLYVTCDSALNCEYGDRHKTYDHDPFIDHAIVGVARLGVKKRGAHFGGEKADISFIASATKLRWPPAPDVHGPKSRVLSPISQTDPTIAIEVTLGY